MSHCQVQLNAPLLCVCKPKSSRLTELCCIGKNQATSSAMQIVIEFERLITTRLAPGSHHGNRFSVPTAKRREILNCKCVLELMSFMPSKPLTPFTAMIL
mmetsp:Transcript_89558/g.168705  ORF Transcript_89558/g.168705 Transcript_89558/m.168705 type:complete len:100 (-) Transcript_89558:51-350(-)